MHDSWFTRIILFIAALVVVSLSLVLRAMARELRKDAKDNRNAAKYDHLFRKFAAITLVIVITGIWYRSWLLVLTFGSLSAVMTALFGLNRGAKT